MPPDFDKSKSTSLLILKGKCVDILGLIIMDGRNDFIIRIY